MKGLFEGEFLLKIVSSTEANPLASPNSLIAVSSAVDSFLRIAFDPAALTLQMGLANIDAFPAEDILIVARHTVLSAEPSHLRAERYGLFPAQVLAANSVHSLRVNSSTRSIFNDGFISIDWNDARGNGSTENGRLQTLNAAGVQSINTTKGQLRPVKYAYFRLKCSVSTPRNPLCMSANAKATSIETKSIAAHKNLMSAEHETHQYRGPSCGGVVGRIRLQKNFAQ